MTDYDMMVEEHILEYEARRKHLDELLARAERGIGDRPEAAVYKGELASLRRERQKLMNHIEQLKKKARAEWQEETIEEAGPMIVWEAVAKNLEALVEKIEQKHTK